MPHREYPVNIEGQLPVIGIVMGSWSDWKVMQQAWDVLTELGVPCERGVVSAHRTPELVGEYARRAEAKQFSAVIAGAGGAAHLPGMLAAELYTIPVIGVPVKTSTLMGLESLLSIAPMPPGIPVATMAIDGALNAGIMAAMISGRTSLTHKGAVGNYRASLSELVEDNPDPASDPR